MQRPPIDGRLLASRMTDRYDAEPVRLAREPLPPARIVQTAARDPVQVQIHHDVVLLELPAT